MKLLVFSDVHGNLPGLQAVFEAAQCYDQALCLGDVVGYGASPNQCCELLRARGVLCLSGNHDAAAVGLLPYNRFNSVARAAMDWTRQVLTEENALWLRQLPDYFESPFCEGVHASLRDHRQEYLLNVLAAEGSFELLRSELCFFGHTHVARAFSQNAEGAVASRIFADGGLLELVQTRRLLVNPGSCGQPRDGNPLAKFCMLDTEAKTIRFLGVPYNYFAASAAIVDAGLPAILGDRLFQGK
jgi:predicted phosphodiesterase